MCRKCKGTDTLMAPVPSGRLSRGLARHGTNLRGSKRFPSGTTFLPKAPVPPQDITDSRRINPYDSGVAVRNIEQASWGGAVFRRLGNFSAQCNTSAALASIFR